jgi:carbon storage regulator CsrA
MIGEEVAVIALDATGNQVKVCVNAFREVAVRREEVLECIQRENELTVQQSTAI